jgi:hypothetical protein
MSERSIILRPEEVRAILDGRKTQLRRVVKPKPDHLYDPYSGGYECNTDGACPLCEPFRCPFGVPGDRLWAKETWATTLSLDHVPAARLASGAPVQYRNCESNVPGYPRLLPPVVRWRSAVHMPRWASRITLEVEAVRAERLQDMVRADAFMEGCPLSVAGADGDIEAAHLWFRDHWNKANPKHPYDSNPFVWVATFKRVEGK